MAELHLFGEVVGANDFALPSLFCKYSVETGVNFRILQGQSAGQTQCDTPQVRVSWSGLSQHQFNEPFRASLPIGG